jgi:starch synthase
MEVLMVSAELSPYARQTQAGDAVAALGKALRQLGHDVTLALPRYPRFEAGGLLLARRLTPLSLPSGTEVMVFDGQLSSGVRLALFDAPVLFDRPGVYGEGSRDYPDNAKRFGLLSQAAAALVRHATNQGRTFDIVHLHDWPAALVPAALRMMPSPAVATVLTIHDVTRQGRFPASELESLGLSEEIGDELRVEKELNVLKGGIVMADAVTTVSPSYAEELCSRERAGELAALLADDQKPLLGLYHGIDYAIYNPATDPLVISRYDAEDPSNKGRCKTALIRELKLELELEVPLVAAITGHNPREAELLREALPEIMKNEVTCIVAGDDVAALEALVEQYPGRLFLLDNPDEARLHRLYAGAEMLIIPFEHDPSGTQAMVAQRYGTLPIARATGGLRDAVVDCDSALETGTGFLFEENTAEALLGALQRALAAYASGSFSRLVRRVMRLDVGWDRPARRYLQVYRQTLAAQR